MRCANLCAPPPGLCNLFIALTRPGTDSSLVFPGFWWKRRVGLLLTILNRALLTTPGTNQILLTIAKCGQRLYPRCLRNLSENFRRLMCTQQNCPLVFECVDLLPKYVRGFFNQFVGRFVEDQNLRAFDSRTGDGEAQLPPAAKPCAVFADSGLVLPEYEKAQPRHFPPFPKQAFDRRSSSLSDLGVR